MVLNGVYEMSVSVDTPVDVLFWENNDSENDPTAVNCPKCSESRKWLIKFSSSLICGVGVKTKQLTVINGCRLRALGAKDAAKQIEDVHEFPPGKKKDVETQTD